MNAIKEGEQHGIHRLAQIPAVRIAVANILIRSTPSEDLMIILRQQMRSKPERTDDVFAALSAIVLAARATPGVIRLDIARDLLDPDSFVATGIYEDGAALERQESAPEVHTAMAMFPEALAAPPDRTIYEASRDPELI
jgi:quinol monooxygenase YgiN